MSNGPFRLAALAAAVLTASLGFAGENDVLYWMVDENTTITTGAGTSTTIGDFFDNSKSDFFGRSNFGQIVVKATWLFDLIRTKNDRIK